MLGTVMLQPTSHVGWCCPSWTYPRSANENWSFPIVLKDLRRHPQKPMITNGIDKHQFIDNEMSHSSISWTISEPLPTPNGTQGTLYVITSRAIIATPSPSGWHDRRTFRRCVRLSPSAGHTSDIPRTYIQRTNAEHIYEHRTQRRSVPSCEHHITDLHGSMSRITDSRLWTWTLNKLYSLNIYRVICCRLNIQLLHYFL